MKATTLAAVVLWAGALLSLAAGTGYAQEPVFVTNFPEVQEIAGEVKLASPIPHSDLVAFDAVEVTTVGRDEATGLISGGLLEADGFTSVVLSLAGEVKGSVPRTASLGVILIPDESFVAAAFREGSYLFPIEVEADIPANSPPYVDAKPARQQLAFPRYRVYFYNTGSRTVRAQLYAMLLK